MRGLLPNEALLPHLNSSSFDVVLTDPDFFFCLQCTWVFFPWFFCTIPCETDFEVAMSDFSPYLSRGCSQGFLTT
ncbi:hypothetical protein U0070_007994 [Myodes glareolus]|uniref:Uncharacterized protein n=1 Tax=Myodes glareolus TaxID=447135 RepID=A0AAW0IFS0_MYOGA